MTLSDLPYYVSLPIANQFSKAKNAVTTIDEDRVYIITGREGSGKSWLAMQFAYLLDRNFSLKNIVFTSDDFMSAIRHFPRGSAIIFDEAFNGLSSKGAISKENKKLITLLMECRQRNLFVFIVLPSFFLLEKYVGIFRSHALFNVIKDKRNPKKRYYKVYNYHQKKLLYIFGKQLMDYSKPKVFKKHNFYNKLPPTIVEAEYRAKKDKHFKHKEKEKPPETKAMEERNYLLYYMNKTYKETYVNLSKILKEGGFSLNESVIGRYCRDVSDKRQKT